MHARVGVPIHMLLFIRPLLRRLALSVAAFTFLVCGAALCAAQSSDISYPAPIFSEEVAGRIVPRDIGDARRTRHFYIFRGTEGDLLIDVEGAELSGDIDIFTATTLRPLLKVTLYGGTATKVSKSVFLRKEETLILRVEARAAGDAEGTYRIRFGGSFAPAPAGLAQAPETIAPDTASNAARKDRNVRRVTSTGARIDEPVVEVPSLEAAAPAPTPAESSGARAEGGTPPKREAPRSSRRGRGTRPAPARSKAPTAGKTPAETAGETTTSGNTADAAATPTTEAAREPDATARPSGTRAPRTPRRRTAPRRSTPAARAETATPSDTTPTESSTPAPAAAASPRLIIVTKDGETLEREMSTVRRVTVENNQVVVVTKDGKTIRQPMANVLKMSIEP